MKSVHCFQTKYAAENYASSRDLWNVPIFESNSFVALPTVGALVEGWLLVVPKIYTLSFAKLSTSQFSELEIFLSEIVPVVESIYGPVSIFEHGPAMTGMVSCVGCGVDYAHLHLVPVQFDLLEGAKKIARNIRWEKINSLNEASSSIAVRNGYWFLKQDYRSDVCFLGTCENGKPISQLFRKVIAEHLGCPSAYDWKQFLDEKNIVATVHRLTESLQPA